MPIPTLSGCAPGIRTRGTDQILTMAEDKAAVSLIKEFLSRSLGQLGVGAVLAVLLMLYYQSESRRWDDRMKADEKRWEQLFRQYREGTSQALDAIEVCCHDRLKRLERIEQSRGGGAPESDE